MILHTYYYWISARVNTWSSQDMDWRSLPSHLEISQRNKILKFEGWEERRSAEAKVHYSENVLNVYSLNFQAIGWLWMIMHILIRHLYDQLHYCYLVCDLYLCEYLLLVSYTVIVHTHVERSDIKITTWETWWCLQIKVFWYPRETL